jgi:hypothetical protein
VQVVPVELSEKSLVDGHGMGNEGRTVFHTEEFFDLCDNIIQRQTFSIFKRNDPSHSGGCVGGEMRRYSSGVGEFRLDWLDTRCGAGERRCEPIRDLGLGAVRRGRGRSVPCVYSAVDGV